MVMMQGTDATYGRDKIPELAFQLFYSTHA